MERLERLRDFIEQGLVDVGLVDKRQQRTADSQGIYTYYRPTTMGWGILEHGVEELMRSEREFNDAYA